MKLRTTLTILLSLSVMITSYAEEIISNQVKKNVVLWKRNTSGRPNLPSASYIECYYGNGYIGVVFPDQVSGISVTIGDPTMPTWHGYLTPENPDDRIPMFVGPYTVTLTTDYNDIFRDT